MKCTDTRLVTRRQAVLGLAELGGVRASDSGGRRRAAPRERRSAGQSAARRAELPVLRRGRARPLHPQRVATKTPPPPTAAPSPTSASSSARTAWPRWTPAAAWRMARPCAPPSAPARRCRFVTSSCPTPIPTTFSARRPSSADKPRVRRPRQAPQRPRSARRLLPRTARVRAWQGPRRLAWWRPRCSSSAREASTSAAACSRLTAHPKAHTDNDLSVARHPDAAPCSPPICCSFAACPRSTAACAAG